MDDTLHAFEVLKVNNFENVINTFFLLIILISSSLVYYYGDDYYYYHYHCLWYPDMHIAGCI